MAGERIRSSLFAVDDADRGVHDETDVAQRRDRVEQRAAGCDDVLDEAHALALLVRALEPVRRAVLLCLLADDQERQARTRATRRPRARRRRARARRAASRRARAPARSPRCARRSAAAARAASRSGTCRGSSATACRSAGESRLRDTRARRAPRRAVGVAHERTAASASCASGQQRSASLRPVDERDHRAVVEVDVDALAAGARTSAGRRRCRRRCRCAKPTSGEQPTPHRPPSSAAAASASAARRRRRAGSSSGRRRRGRPSARGRSSRRSAGRRRGRRRRCPSPVEASSCVTSPSRAEAAGALEQVGAGPRERLGGAVVGERRAVHGAALVEEHGGLDLGRDLGQIGECLRRRPWAERTLDGVTASCSTVRPGPAPDVAPGTVAACKRRPSHRAKFFADRGTHLAAMVAYFALLSFVPLIFLALSLLGLVHRADASDFLVKELSRAFPTHLAQEHPHARPPGAGQRGDARDRRRRRAALVVALALQRARVGVQHRLRPAEPLVPAREGRRRRRHGRDDHDALRQPRRSARSASRSLKRYAPGFVGEQRRGLHPLDRRLAARRVRLRARGVPAPDERASDGARRAARARSLAAIVLEASFQIVPVFVRLADVNPTLRVLGGPVILLLWLYVMANVIVFGAELNWWYAERRALRTASPLRSTASRSARAERARCELRAFHSSPSSRDGALLAVGNEDRVVAEAPAAARLRPRSARRRCRCRGAPSPSGAIATSSET